MSNRQNGRENPRTPLNSAYDLPEKSQQSYVYMLEHNASSGVRVLEATDSFVHGQESFIAEFDSVNAGYQFLRMCSLARLSPEQAGAAAVFFQKQAAEEQEVSIKKLTEERDILKEALKQADIKWMELGAGILMLRKTIADLEKDLQTSQDPVLQRKIEELEATVRILKKRLQKTSVAQSAAEHQDFTDLSKQLKTAQDLIEQQRAEINILHTHAKALVTRLEKEKRGSLEGTKDIVALRRTIYSLEKQLEKAHKDLEDANKLAEKNFEDFSRVSMYSLRQEDIIAKLKAGLV